MIENSEVRDSIFARRKEIAEGMVKKEKVSVGKEPNWQAWRYGISWII